MLRTLRSEIYRLRRRWMPWIILGMVVVLGFVFYELIYFTLSSQLQLMRSGNVPASAAGQGGAEAAIAQAEETLRQLTPKHVAEFGVSLIAGVGSVMLIVFAASHMGNEYGWGTLRTLLASGVSRPGFLVTKLASIALFAAVFTILGVIATIAASFVVSTQAGFDTGGFDAGAVAVAAVKTAYCFLPYLSLAALIALWSRSSGAGIAAGLVIYFAESIVMQLLISFNKDYVSIANAGLSRNVTSLSRISVSVNTGQPAGAGAALPDQTQAAIVLAVWTIAFVAVAFWRLRARDVTLS